jgi:hypothetical protein
MMKAMISGVIGLAGLLALPAQAEAPSGYEPLAFLVGHCWKGTFPDSQVTDEHCFSWIYGGKFVRDEHIVRGMGPKDAFGESIYVWDAARRELQYLYIESAGGFSRGSVASEGDTLVFAPSTYTQDHSTHTIRSRWQRAGADAYEVLTETQNKDGWAPLFSVQMHRE